MAKSHYWGHGARHVTVEKDTFTMKKMPLIEERNYANTVG